ncbi:MAG: N-acetylmuramic acid 6-phosphate etherase [candidate division Zixibacteria bacterium]|nr:N-acetylmuramic acid 6-phosphate etherase [candidate division Zixibacteria bacterium]
MARELYDHLKVLTTEAINPKTKRLDRMTPLQILGAMNAEDRKVAGAVRKVLPEIAEAVAMVTESFTTGGRLIYAGAGTSGRLGVLDASECPPTFGVSPKMVQGIIAGGRRALVRSREGVEDDRASAQRAVDKLSVSARDTVLGIAASGRTPYPLAALRRARQRKGKTILLVCNDLGARPSYVDLVINPVLGPEVLAGSTRLKAGTACKMILNLITTTAMVQLGKCYGNLMVDLRATSKKLIERSKLILVEIAGISYQAAGRLLKRSRGEVKTALVMHFCEVDYREAKKTLAATDGKLHRILRLHRK